MRTQLPLALIAAAFSCSLFIAPAQARARVFVASYGSDGNPCTFGSPCKTFQQAVNVVDPGGEVTAIDSAGFGPITISQSVTITSPAGVEAGIVPVSGGTAIAINAPGAKVTLRGLTIEGAGVGQIGIMFSAGESLIIESCVIHNVLGAGIQFVPSATSEMFVLNTVVADVGNTAIQVSVGGDNTVKVKVSLRGVAVYNNIYGVYFVSGSGGLGSINAKISESEVGGSSAIAIVSQTSNGVPVSVMVRDSAVAHNATGCAAVNSGAILRLAQSIITGNAISWFANSGASVLSYADNAIDGNSDGDPAPPTIGKK